MSKLYLYYCMVQKTYDFYNTFTTLVIMSLYTNELRCYFYMSGDC
jgi:hypothetical protein